MDRLTDMLRCADVSAPWRDQAFLAGMARFEAALAAAEAHAGLIPADAARVIGQVCSQFEPDAAALAAIARRASTLAIPFVKALTDAVAAVDPAAARWVHWGATSQDVVDAATVLAARDSLGALDALLVRAGDALAMLAQAHAGTPMTGRTLLQAAVPVPFGWKAAGWLAQVHRARTALMRVGTESLVLAFGGASGTLASLGGEASRVADALGARLSLPVPPISWHSARDRYARLGAELAIATGAAAKIGRDVSLMMQPEVGEAFEPAGGGRGGSSAMPHKRNPVGAMLALEAAYRAPSLAAALMTELASEHERGLGTWQNSALQLSGLFDAAGSAFDAIAEVLEGLRVDADRMRSNLEATRGFVFAEAVTVALAAHMGKTAAASLMERVCGQALDSGLHLRDALARDPTVSGSLDASTLARLFDPAAQFQGAQTMIRAVLDEWRVERS